MYLVHVSIGSTIVDRSVFDTLQSAEKYARDKSQEKVWKLSDTQIYYGNIESDVYDIQTLRSSSYIDEHILSFS
jgi:hypothetical protein